MPCSNAAKTRNPLKLPGVPQTPEPISAVSRPKFTILSGHMQEVLLFSKFFPIVDICLSSEVVRWCQNGDSLRPVFPASRVQHISDMHSKFALRPHHVWKTGSMVDIQSPTAEIRRGKKRRKNKIERNQGKNVMACPIS